MLANEIVERYIEALLEVPDIWNTFSIPPVWAPEVIRAVTRAGQHASPMQWQERRHRDAIRRTEHLSLDVCIADPSSWGPPVFIARHVSEPRRAAIQHAAWALLATRTQRRVLVAYEAKRTYATELRSSPQCETCVPKIPARMCRTTSS